ncbi:MAG TPA: dihydroorotase [Candidatus Dormibacteraeota bacterium]|nr:dihydroorotase [Candidatus Dormibacteraeota bacterium]
MSERAILLRGGRVIDPAQGLDALRDVLIERGCIAKIAERIDDAEAAGALELDVRGAVVAPGFIDPHVHLREPGQSHKETIASGCAAAVAGGFTAVAAMPNTQPAIDSPQIVREVIERARAAGLARVYPIGAITRRREGKELAPYGLLAQAGAVAFSDDGSTVDDARVLRRAALYARDLEAPFISHCEEAALRAGGVMNEGATSARLGIAGSPRLAEDVVVARDLLIAGDTGKRWHIAHLSTGRGLELVKWARSQGIRATCEVSPHHLVFTDRLFEGFTARGRVCPPLRVEDDIAALRAGVRDGSVDVLATDHAPHTAGDKAGPLSETAVGFTGLEIAVGAYAHALPDLPLERMVALLSTNVARLLDVPGGTLAIGSAADVTVLRDESWLVDPEAFQSMGRITPFAGMRLPRRAVATIVDGRVVYDALGGSPRVLRGSPDGRTGAATLG